jgi:hypothetical protein
MPRFPAVQGVLLAVALLPSVARGTTATGLSSFEAIEEPSVRFFPATGRFEPDTFVNITEVGGGAVRMLERYNAAWWDSDRDTQNKDRQRAEVKGLGPHQINGDTFEYSTTWRLNPGFRGTAGFCHLFQLKAINGDDGAPLVTLLIHGDTATVEANPAGPKIIAREFPWKPDTWQMVRIRIKTSPRADGELMVSVDGDAFQGRTGIELSRPDATEYRPKWGLYRRAAVHAPMGDDYVEHKNLTAQKVGAPEIANAALENEARQLAKTSSPLKALAWLQSQPASPGRDYALGSLAARWAETDSPAAMAWAEAQPRGAVRLDAIERVFTRWADRDVTAAAKWLHAHAPAPALDELLWLFTTDTTYRYVNRPVALDALPLIADPMLRAAAFDHVVLIWARQNPADAARFLTASPALTAAQKEPILNKISARGPRAAD